MSFNCTLLSLTLIPPEGRDGSGKTEIYGEFRSSAQLMLKVERQSKYYTIVIHIYHNHKEKHSTINYCISLKSRRGGIETLFCAETIQGQLVFEGSVYILDQTSAYDLSMCKMYKVV